MTRCISCLSEYNPNASTRCPVCGFDISGYRHDPAALPPGTLVGGRYIIGKRADYDRCGYSINYAALDTQTGSRVSVVEFYPREFVARNQATGALTVSRQDLIGKLEVGKKSFIMEAMKLKKLHETNPRILRIYDSFPERNTAYMITEFLEGQTLEQYVSANKKMEYPEVASTFREILGSLSDIHSGGLIHKYIYPKNIFITNDGRVVLINFGAFRSGIAESSSSVASTLEIGFAPYEQYSSTRQQGRSVDIYAVGACMYYALTGLRPPAAPDRVDQDSLVPIGKAAKGVPTNTAYIIMNALNMKPENRPRQISEFIHAIEGKGRVVRKKEKLKKEKVSLPRWIIPVMLLIAVAATGFFIWNSRGSNQTNEIPAGMTPVPNVSGKSLDEATDMLDKIGLSMIISGRVYDDYLDKDTVLSQTPHPGSLAYSGSTVEVIASAPSQRIQVPNVTGMSRDSAKTALENAGLTVTFSEIEDDTVLFDTVVQQSIEPQSEVLAGTEIVLSVNIKTNDIEVDHDTLTLVPNLTNLTYSEAFDLILDSRLNLMVERYEYSSTVSENYIISQTPNPNTQIAQGELVTVVVSKGSETILAPDLQYVTESQARSILSSTSLNLNVHFENSSSVLKGLIIRQSPAANTPLSPGAYIDVYISSGNPVTVPYVIGSSQIDAQNAIISAGLSCSFSYENSDSAPAGQVIAQSVPSGSQLDYGSTVVVTISSGSKTVPVTGVSLNSTSLSLKKNSSATLYASVTPSNATNTSVSWNSSDRSVAEVNSSGIVTARGEGSAVITVTTGSGNYQASCNVTVTPNTAWSGWSKWSETYPEGHGDIETQTQYSMRTVKTFSQTGSGFLNIPQGYTYKSEYVEYGNWSNWQWTDSPATNTSTYEVRSYTGYLYYRFVCPCGASLPYYSTSSNMTHKYMIGSASCNHTISADSYQELWPAYLPDHYEKGYTCWNSKGASIIDGVTWYYDSTKPQMTRKIWEYRERTKTTNYEYWTTWSDWTFDNLSSQASDKCEVRQRTVYRYRDLVEVN